MTVIRCPVQTSSSDQSSPHLEIPQMLRDSDRAMKVPPADAEEILVVMEDLAGELGSKWKQK